MDLSRKYGGRMDAYPRNRQPLPIGIFGSFRRYALLKTLRDLLNASGYAAYLSRDLEKRLPRHKGEDPDVYNLRISQELINGCSICIFIIFSEKHGEENVNQSVSQEVQYLYDQLVAGKRRDNPQVLVLVEDGCRPASLFRGLVKTCRPRWKEAQFSTREDLLKAARQFCWNVVE
jgi:hypothetical protein